MIKSIAIMYILISFGLTSGTQLLADINTSQSFAEILLNQGVSTQRVFGADDNGIPLLCGTTEQWKSKSKVDPQFNGDLPVGTRGWTCCPGVIRNDGLDSFHVEVDVNGEVARVTMDGISLFLVAPNTPPFDLSDDGLDGDRIAGDNVFTSGPFRYNIAITMPDFFRNNPNSPPGLYNVDVGTVTVEELGGTETRFLIKPSAGLLRFDIEDANSTVLSPDITVSPHLINIRTSEHETQRSLRFLGGDLRNLTNSIYQVVPDVIHFFVFFSTNKIENIPKSSSVNFSAGLHVGVRTDFTGTGLSLSDASSAYGSNSVLMSVNIIDAYNRGIYSANVTHEILHQWVSFTNTSIGLSEGGHYKSRCSVGSLVGGFRWIDNGAGSFTRYCSEGGSGAYHAPPLDKYMMGLIEGDTVAPLYVSDPGGALDCGEIIDDPYVMVTIADVQNVHGVRSPGPVDAQRAFTIAFVAETHDRFLNSTEMTYYEILADHYSKPGLPEEPAPYIGFNWASIDRFFGEGTNWSTEIPHFSDFDLDYLSVFASHWLEANCDLKEWCDTTDLNHDSNVNLLDFAVLAEHWLEGVTP